MLVLRISYFYKKISIQLIDYQHFKYYLLSSNYDVINDEMQIFKFKKNKLLTKLYKITIKYVLFFDKLPYIHDY